MQKKNEHKFYGVDAKNWNAARSCMFDKFNSKHIWREHNLCFCITGIEVMANRFSVVQTQIRKKPYDFLDQRKQEFGNDYEDFQRQIKELHVIYFKINSERLVW